jgi:cell division septum initiation protein DivIVA
MLAESPKPRKRLKQLRQQISAYQRAVSSLEHRIAEARTSEPDTPGVRAALGAAAQKLRTARGDLETMETELSRMLGKVR